MWFNLNENELRWNLMFLGPSTVLQQSSQESMIAMATNGLCRTSVMSANDRKRTSPTSWCSSDAGFSPLKAETGVRFP